MDHMRISGNEPSSVILLPNKVVQKLKSDAPKVPNQAKAKRDGVINPKNYNFSQINTENVHALKRYEINRKLHWNNFVFIFYVQLEYIYLATSIRKKDLQKVSTSKKISTDLVIC